LSSIGEEYLRYGGLSMAERLAAGRELDALVAEKVMGWEPYHDGAWLTGEQLPDWGGPQIVGRTWSPSTDITAAWQVVEKLNAQRYDIAIGNWTHEAGIIWQVMIENSNVERKSFPLALCLAALKATKNDPPEAQKPDKPHSTGTV
jgi:Phage ABA sandwich domain